MEKIEKNNQDLLVLEGQQFRTVLKYQGWGPSIMKLKLPLRWKYCKTMVYSLAVIPWMVDPEKKADEEVDLV